MTEEIKTNDIVQRTQSTNDKFLPEGSKIILVPEKVTGKIKKERTEKQRTAFEKMRSKRLENDDKRKIDKQKEMDDIKKEQEKSDEEEIKQRAEELKQKLGVDVEVLKKRGRKAGQHIPYSRAYKQSVQPIQPVQPIRPETVSHPVYNNPYMAMLLSKMKR